MKVTTAGNGEKRECISWVRILTSLFGEELLSNRSVRLLESPFALPVRYTLAPPVGSLGGCICSKTERIAERMIVLTALL